MIYNGVHHISAVVGKNYYALNDVTLCVNASGVYPLKFLKVNLVLSVINV